MFEANSSGFLSALQLGDSFFPVGQYAHSQGLEGMVHRELVNSVGEVEEFLRNQLTWSLLPGDGVALLNAWRAAQARELTTIVAIDRLLYALKLPAELRAASTQVGQRLLTETAPFVSCPIHADYKEQVSMRQTPGNGAVALGVVGFTLGLSDEATLLVFCHTHAVSVLGAASRLLPFTHSDAQGILHRLQPLVTDLVGEIRQRSWEEMTAFTPELDIISMNHEDDDLRLFAS